MTSNLTELKQRLNDLIICSGSCMEALPIQGNLRYTGHLSGPHFDLEMNCINKYLMVIVIISSIYPFFSNVVLI